MNEASHGMSRTFPPTTYTPPGHAVRPPQMPRTRMFPNLLNVLQATPSFQGADPRLTAQGTAPTRQMPPYVPLGVIDPRNVFDMRPA